jgi:hypothetical protein
MPQVNLWTSDSRRQPGQLFLGQSCATERTGVLSKRLALKKKTKKPEPGVIRFGLFCPTSDWQHWQFMSIDE